MKQVTRLFTYFFTIFLTFFLTHITVHGAINFSLDPIKYELEMNPGQSITLPASIKNNSGDIVTMPTSVSDFQSSGTSGTPSFVRKSELVYPDQELSTWITLSSESVTLAPGEKTTINFTINVPEDAIPGGHYGAVFFKKPSSEVSTSGNIGINVDYGILILVTVTGDIIIDGEVGDISVGGATGRNKKNNSINEDINQNNGEGETEIQEEVTGGDILGITLPTATFDDCPLGDFSKSNFDGICIDKIFPYNKETDTGNTINNTFENISPLGKDEDFGISFDIPFRNTGTTHVKPTGKIILEDSQGNQIQQIGKEIVVNEYGAIIGENIVDYIPVNDTDGNVLPNTDRIFSPEWKGFPYQEYDYDIGELVTKYKTPSEYYTEKNKQEAGFLMFWERVCEAKRHEKITAFIDVSYTNEQGETVEFNSAKDFYITYTEEYVGINPYVVLPIIIFFGLLILLILWRIVLILKKKRRCKHCNTPVRKNWHVCPKCKKELGR